MNIHALAADIASRVPEMARDSRQNNEAVITELIRQEKAKGEKPVIVLVDDTKLPVDLLDRELREKAMILDTCRVLNLGKFAVKHPPTHEATAGQANTKTP